jgi:hypothetical protein
LIISHIINELYKKATAEPYQFLYINMLARDVNEMFYKSFESRLVPSDSS